MSKTICVFGASITWGANDEERGGWVNRLRLFLNKKFDYEVILYNLGVLGDTTADLLERFSNEARVREPDVIIFAIGNNDAIFVPKEDCHLVDFKKFKLNIEKLANLAKGFTDKVIFMGLSKIDESLTTPIPWRKEYYYYNKYIEQYSYYIKEFCQENGIKYLNLLNLLDKDDLDDGLHPNAQGHEKIFQGVKKFLLNNKII